ncbi:MAG: SPOR domain-containing protein [Methylophilaceae bacterium]
MPPDQLNEQEIQFKKRARRRLVGAVALVLLMVTILPMVLDDRAGKTSQPEIAITIPSQDGAGFTSKILPVAPETPLPASPSAAVPTPPAPPVESVKPDEAASNKNLEVAPPAVPLSNKSADAMNTPAQAAAQKAPPEKKQPQPSSTQGNSFAVQIGVFSDPANVKQLQQKLLAQGYTSYTEKIDTAKGEKIRLRAGSFVTREMAESALAKIKNSGLSGMVVTK